MRKIDSEATTRDPRDSNRSETVRQAVGRQIERTLPNRRGFGHGIGAGTRKA